MSSDFGVYSGLSVERTVLQLRGMPLYLRAEGYGRLIEQTSKVVSGNGELLWATELRPGDSLFVHVADSVISGREGQLGGARYISVPERTANVLSATAGVRAKKEARLSPGLVYSFREYALRYPTIVDDRRNRRHSLNLLVASESIFFLDYAGGIQLTWEREDKLFRTDLEHHQEPDIDSSLYWLNLSDYQGLHVFVTHELFREWENGAALRYLFDISRRQKRFPYYFTTGTAFPGSNEERIQSYEDDYWIVQQHAMRITAPALEWLSVAVFGEYAQNAQFYTNARRSADNAIDHSVRFGLDVVASPHERVRVNSALRADGTVTEYQFPKVHEAPAGLPPQRRGFSALLDVGWVATPWLTLQGKWEEVYWDDGRWNGSEYWNSDTVAATDFYAIAQKWLDTRLSLGALVGDAEKIRVGGGCELYDLFYREWNGLSGRYEENTLGIGRVSLEPFLSLSSGSKSPFRLEGQLRRTFHNPFDEKLDNPQPDVWNLILNFSMSL
jgi:hypothetical protein